MRYRIDCSAAAISAPCLAHEVAQPAPTVSNEAAEEATSLTALKLPPHWFAGPEHVGKGHTQGSDKEQLCGKRKFHPCASLAREMAYPIVAEATERSKPGGGAIRQLGGYLGV